MSIRQCPACSMRVIPKADGNCPSCGAPLAAARPESTSPPAESREPAIADSRTGRAREPEIADSRAGQAREPEVSETVSQDWSTDPEAIVVMPNRAIAIVMMVASLAFLLLGALAVIAREEISSRFVMLGVICLLLMPVLFIYAVRKLFSTEPVLVVNRDGVFDNASPASIGLIKWSEIKELYVYTDEGVRFLVVDVWNPETVLSRQRGVRGALARFESGADKNAPIRIPQTFLSMRIRDLLEQVDERFEVSIRQPDE